MSTNMSLIWAIVSCFITMFLIANENSKFLEKVAMAVLSNHRYARCKKCGRSWNVSKHVKIKGGYICPACAKK